MQTEAIVVIVIVCVLAAIVAGRHRGKKSGGSAPKPGEGIPKKEK